MTEGLRPGALNDTLNTSVQQPLKQTVLKQRSFAFGGVAGISAVFSVVTWHNTHFFCFLFFFVWKFPVDKRQKIAAGVREVASPRSALRFFLFVCLFEGGGGVFI